LMSNWLSIGLQDRRYPTRNPEMVCGGQKVGSKSFI